MSCFEDLESSFARIFCDDRVVGCGFLITHHHLLTCAHVVNEALSKDQDSQDRPLDSIYFDLYLSDPDKLIAAKVIHWMPMNRGQVGEDIAVLQVLGDLLPSVVPVKLAIADNKLTQLVKIPGLPENWHDDICWVDRIIKGPSSKQFTQLGFSGLKDEAIQGGFSGAPVWNDSLQTVVGMMVEVLPDNEEQEKASLMISANILSQAWSGLAYVALENILKPHEEKLSTTFSFAYGKSCSPDWPCSLPTTLAQQIQALNDMPMSRGHDALMWFVVYLAAALESNNVDSSLVQKIRAWANKIDSEFSQLVQQVQNSIQEKLEKAYLMIVIKKSSNKRSGDRYTIDGYFIYNQNLYSQNSFGGIHILDDISNKKQLVSYEELRLNLSKIIDRKNELYPYVDFTIELFLPEELLNKPIDTWLMEDDHEPIGCKYCLVIRSENRTTLKYLIRSGVPWKQKWNHMPKPGDKLAGDILLSGDNISFKRTSQELKNADKIGLKLYKEPLKTGIESTLLSLESSGAPVAVWLREPLPEINESIDSLLSCCLYELPMIIMNQRRVAFGEEDDRHIGHHLVLLWEDFDRMPPGTKITSQEEKGKAALNITHNNLRMV
jgi:vWA-MoxR associated protein C-terminal domain/vWA-MoxR associated protein middle region (VMAP-M) 1/Trypsin-like peptidase domain